MQPDNDNVTFTPPTTPDPWSPTVKLCNEDNARLIECTVIDSPDSQDIVIVISGTFTA